MAQVQRKIGHTESSTSRVSNSLPTSANEASPIQRFLLLTHMSPCNHPPMRAKAEVWQGTLALMVLKTLEQAGSLHGYGIARQIEETSANLLSVNYGTLYPALLRLEQDGYIASEWGVSDNNRRAKYYQLTRAGRKQIARETCEWEQMKTILARFLAPKEGLA